MRLTAQAKTAVEQLIKTVIALKQQEGIGKLVMPSIELFHTSLLTEVKEQLRIKISSLMAMTRPLPYGEVIDEYQQAQTKYLFLFVDSISVMLNVMLTDEGSLPALLTKLLLFLSNGQVALILSDKTNLDLDALNPVIKLRLSYSIIDALESVIHEFKNGHEMIMADTLEYEILKKIDTVIAVINTNAHKRKSYYHLFFDEIHIREASIIATGALPRTDQLSDIFMVYKAVDYNPQKSANAAYYQLGVKTLSHLCEASQSFQEGLKVGSFQFSINPIHEETTVGHSLVRKSRFGINISYEDEVPMTPHMGSLKRSAFNDSYSVKPSYRLNPELKILYLAHIATLTAQMNSSPKHSHHRRRAEKLTALSRVVQADDDGDLSPLIFKQAKQDKYYVFVAWGESKTKKLIEQAEMDIKQKLWLKLTQEVSGVGQYGYAIKDSDLLQKILDKYLGFSEHKKHNASADIHDLLTMQSTREAFSGTALWNYDKKMALEILLIAHEQQLLHPALFQAIETHYPMLYARSFSWLRASAVEKLFSEAKENILQAFWNDAENEAFMYQSPEKTGGNHAKTAY